MINELILFIVGTVIFTFLTMNWKSKIKTSLEQIQKNALICGTLISVFQLILLFAEFLRVRSRALLRDAQSFAAWRNRPFPAALFSLLQ